MQANPALSKIIDEDRIGFVKEHGSKKRPVKKRPVNLKR